MNQLTTFTIRSKMQGYVWLFKYHLNGSFHSFEVLDSTLSTMQKKWLKENFPFDIEIINQWQKSLKDNFEIIKAEPVLEFETLWEIYGNKVKKEASEKAFNKLNKAEKIKCFLAIAKYKKYLSAKPHIDQAHLVTWINGKRFNDEY